MKGNVIMDGIKTKIRIDNEISNGKRGICFDEILSHHVGEKELQEILKRSRVSAWKSDEKEGQELGTHLFDLFNGSGGKLRETIKKSYDRGEPLHLYFAIPFELDALPIELLFDKHFLQLDSNIHIIRQVTDRNRLKNIVREKRRLKILFMACSPMDLGDSVLQFEKEEESIQKSIEKFQIEMTVEDSGSLEGLKNALMQDNGYDIVHITGHAGIDPKLGPVFYMENEIGGLDEVTPERLGEILKDFPPRVLFLSGCSTGKSDKANEVESFAYRMVEHNIPVALGWGLPVSDTGATIMTTKLYEYLAMGKDIDFAVQRARQEVEKNYHTWPLLRLFTDSAPLIAIIDPERPLMPTSYRKTRYKHLADSEVKVLEYGFIGRRREIQNGTKVLRGKNGKYGLLIRGTAGLGKSCLAGKLIERFHEKSLVVFHGEVRAADIVSKLKRLFEEKNTKSGTDILGSDREYEEKIRGLFHTTFKELPTVLYFDDFEQNLIRHGDIHQIKPEALEVLKPLFYGFDLYKSSALDNPFKGLTNLLITSRYPFVMEVDGSDLVAETLEDIPLMSFKGADLIKKENELPNIKKSKHRGLYLEYGKGNPRLLEWLEKIAGEEEKYDLEELRGTLQGKTEEFISEYLADVIAKTTGEDFHQFLHQAAVFRQPVESAAYGSFGVGDASEYLDKGVSLTLFERENVPGHEPLFWVTPVIRDSQWDMLSQEEKKEMHRIAFQWYDTTIEKSQTPDYRYLEEAVYHALESNNIRGACKHAIVLGGYLHYLLLYKGMRDLLQEINGRITKEIIKEAVKEKDGNIATLINNLGLVVRNLGDTMKAIEYYNKALEIDLAVFGDKHPNVAIRYSNLGVAWNNMANAKKAVAYYSKALEIDLAIFGDKHPNVATIYNNLGAAWLNLGDAKKAIEYYSKALEIDLYIFGDKNANVATIYNNIGLAWRNLGDAKKSIEYYSKALEIVLEVYGEKHPLVSATYNNIGAAWDDMGNAKKAVEYFAKALEIDMSVFGDKHPKVAIDYNNLGLAWNNLDNAKKAIEYFTKALEIDMSVFGDKHPNVANRYSNLGVAWRNLGDAKKAIEYYSKALEIDLSVFGDKHPTIAAQYNNLGATWDNLGDAEKAIKYYSKALEIVLEVYGEKHPYTSTTYNNLGEAWRNLGDAKKAFEYLTKALEIFKAIYGVNHPSTKTVQENLDSLQSN